MIVHELEHLLADRGTITISVAGVPLTLDMRFPHERRYVACAVMNLQYPQRDIDTFLFRKFVRPGDRVLDLGANIGLTALECLAAGASHVYCVEPIKEIVERIPSDHRLTARHAAVAAHAGSVEITLSTEHNQGSTTSDTVFNMFPEIFADAPRLRVPAVTIDSLTHFDVWKIDVEGAELEALDGAKETLSQRPPRVLIMEIYDPFLTGVCERLQDRFREPLRAGLTLDGYQLELSPAGAFEPSRYHSTSPMYVFER